MKKAPTEQKLRGGYYTPSTVASFLASWAIRGKADTVLEPSCGDGAFLEEAVAALKKKRSSPGQIGAQILGLEFEGREARKAQSRLQSLGIHDARIINGDFFAWCRRYGETKFDAVVGNPPFIRYQHFPDKHRDSAFALMRTLGLNPNGLTNAWVPFVCLASTLLKEDGRLAMVIPSELLQVSYSAELRRFLSDSFERVTIFTFRELLFKEAQQEVVLFCGERKCNGVQGINVVELTNAADLASYRFDSSARTSYKPMDHSSEKWTQYFLTRREIGLLRAMRRNEALTVLGEVASVDVGVVTGLNEFFVLTEEDRARRDLIKFTHPVVTRSAHLRGIHFDRSDFENQMQQNARGHLLNLPACTFDSLPSAARNYVREGEDKGFNLGFKCRTRKHWWVVPSPWVPDGFMLRQIHRYPKIAANYAGATCTDTIHRVRLLNGIGARTLASAFTNSLSFAFSEVLGRSYGGGVLELEPTEAEKIPVPLRGAEALDFEEIDQLLATDRVDVALDLVDNNLLKEHVGLTAREIQSLRGIWKKLMDRRHGRKSQGAAS